MNYDFRRQGLSLADLRRSTRDAKIMGVCGGIAEWLGVSSLAVRVVVLVACFVFPVTFVAYFALGFLINKRRRDEYDVPTHERFDSGSRRYRDEPRESFDSIARRFSKIEERLRRAEAEVTSTGFRFNRELKR